MSPQPISIPLIIPSAIPPPVSSPNHQRMTQTKLPPMMSIPPRVPSIDIPVPTTVSIRPTSAISEGYNLLLSLTSSMHNETIEKIVPKSFSFPKTWATKATTRQWYQQHPSLSFFFFFDVLSVLALLNWVPIFLIKICLAVSWNANSTFSLVLADVSNINDIFMRIMNSSATSFGTWRLHHPILTRLLCPSERQSTRISRLDCSFLLLGYTKIPASQKIVDWRCCRPRILQTHSYRMTWLSIWMTIVLQCPRFATWPTYCHPVSWLSMQTPLRVSCCNPKWINFWCSESEGSSYLSREPL